MLDLLDACLRILVVGRGARGWLGCHGETGGSCDPRRFLVGISCRVLRGVRTLSGFVGRETFKIERHVSRRDLALSLYFFGFTGSLVVN